LDNNNESELIVGWSNGRVQAYNLEKGKLIYSLSSSRSNPQQDFPPISKILQGPFSTSSPKEIIIVCSNGEVFGFSPLPLNIQNPQPLEKSEPSSSFMSSEDEKSRITNENNFIKAEEQLRDLSEHKQALLKHLKTLEEKVSSIKSNSKNNSFNSSISQCKVTCTIKPNKINSALMLTLQVNNDYQIKMCVLKNDAIFEDSYRVILPSSLNQNSPFPANQGSLLVPLRYDQNVAMDLQVDLHISNRSSSASSSSSSSSNLNSGASGSSSSLLSSSNSTSNILLPSNASSVSNLSSLASMTTTHSSSLLDPLE
jgi:hypothetical protein